MATRSNGAGPQPKEIFNGLVLTYGGFNVFALMQRGCYSPIKLEHLDRMTVLLREKCPECNKLRGFHNYAIFCGGEKDNNDDADGRE